MIYSITGRSGTMKTTLVNLLYTEFGIPQIKSFTTRPPRSEETADSYNFTQSPPPENALCHTYFGGHHYWITRAQLDEFPIASYVIEENGLLELQSIFPAEEIFSIYTTQRHPEIIVPQDRILRDATRLILPESRYSLILPMPVSPEYLKTLLPGI